MRRQMMLAACSLVLAGLTTLPGMAQEKLAKGEAKAIAEEAFVYGFPMVMNYGVRYETYIDKSSSQYKCPINQLYNTARVFTPKDTAVVTPNSDTPYSFFCADLRAEPVVFTVPEFEKGRYFSVQLIDWYTFNFGYVGSRTTGNGGGSYLVAGLSWKGEKPRGIDKVFRCETEFAFAIIRTQLFNPADIENVKKVQAGYKLQPLSAFLKTPAPPAAPEVKWPKQADGAEDAVAAEAGRLAALRADHAGALVSVFFSARWASMALAPMRWTRSRTWNSVWPKACSEGLATSRRAGARMSSEAAWVMTSAKARA